MFDASFFFHTFLVFPACKRILNYKPNKYSKQFRVAATCAFLALVGIAFCANEVWSTFEVNHFRVVGVARDAELGDIKRAYKARALVMHPDKNPGDPSADDKFAKLHDAYNTLLNEERRQSYDRWGPEGLATLDSGGDPNTAMMVQTAVFYVVWVVMTYILTLSTSHTNSRAYAYGGLGLMLAVDMGMRYSNLDIPVPFGASVTLFEKVFVLRKLYPTFMHGCNTIQMATFVDLEKATMAVMQQLLAQNKDIWIKMRSIEAALEESSRRGGRRGGGGGGGSKSGGMLSATGPNEGASVPEAASGGSVPRNRKAQGMKTATGNEAEPPATPAAPPSAVSKIPSWVWIVGVMIFFQVIKSD